MPLDPATQAAHKAAKAELIAVAKDPKASAKDKAEKLNAYVKLMRGLARR